MFHWAALMEPLRRAVIDIGTNSIKLLVGDVVNDMVRPVEERSEQTRLGAGFYESHMLQPVPIQRTAAAVARFVAMARDAGARSLRAVATSAARDAKNADELLGAVRRASGLRVEVISGEQEAEWVYRGVTSGPELHGIPLLILDVGGGSTEFILGDHGHHSFRKSFPLGSVRLLETLKPGDPPTFHELTVCREWLGAFMRERVEPEMKNQLRAQASSPLTLVGTGGTTTILARMMNQLNTFNRELIDGTKLSRQRVLEYVLDLWAKPLSVRRTMVGLPANRADVIIMGVAIYEAVMTHFDLPELHVSTRGLRFGAILDQP